MFLITWMFDKLGYMPKINMEVGKFDVEFKAAWPFPKEVEKKPAVKKPAVKKAATRKPATKKVK
jgi:hypothetical protein